MVVCFAMFTMFGENPLLVKKVTESPDFCFLTPRRVTTVNEVIDLNHSYLQAVQLIKSMTSKLIKTNRKLPSSCLKQFVYDWVCSMRPPA